MSNPKRTVKVEHPKNPIFELVCSVMAERLPNGTLDCSSSIGVKVIRGDMDGPQDQAEMIRVAIHDLEEVLAGLEDA